MWCGVVTCEDTLSHKASVLCCNYNHVQPGSRGSRQLSSSMSSTSVSVGVNVGVCVGVCGSECGSVCGSVVCE